MSLSIPFTFVGGPGNKAKASEVNANFLAVSSKFTEGVGGIGDGDVASNAGIKGTKLSNTGGNRIPTDRIEDDSIDKDKLRDDPFTAGAPNAAVNTAAHIKDRIITGTKLAFATISRAEMKITVSSHTMTGGNLNPGTPRFPEATEFTPNLPSSGAAMPLAVWTEGNAPAGQLILKLFIDVASILRMEYSHTHDTIPINFDGTVVKVAWVSLA